MKFEIGDWVRIKRTEYDGICGLDVGTEHQVIRVDGLLTFLVGRYPDGSTLELCFDPEELDFVSRTINLKYPDLMRALEKQISNDFNQAMYGDDATAVKFGYRTAEPEPEIEWGEWGPPNRQPGDFQMQYVGGVQQWRYPVLKQPVVETVTLYGRISGGAWSHERYDGDTISISYERKDGKPDWSTLRGEDL